MEPQAAAAAAARASSRGRAPSLPTSPSSRASTKSAFRERFRRSPVKRAKRRGLLRNVAVAIANAGDARQRPWLERLAADADALVAEHARWALERLDARLSAAAGSSGA